MKQNIPTLSEELQNIEARLGEAWEALAVLRTIHEHAKVDAALGSAINSTSGFWKIIHMALNVSIFTGIHAVLENESNSNKSNNSATLHSALKKVMQGNPDPVFRENKQRLVKIAKKYGTYRHKIFAHNDIWRSDKIEEFNRAGFSWASIDNDFIFLDYVWKTLFFPSKGKPIPSETEAQQFYFPNDSSRQAVITHTQTMLKYFAQKA